MTTALSLSTLKKEQWLDVGRWKGSKAKTWHTIQAIARATSTPLLLHNAESFNHHSGKKADAFGILDIIVVEPTKIRGVQACGGSDWQEHIRKLQEHRETCARWLACGVTTIELWGWRKVKRRGQMTWRPRVQLVTLGFLDGTEPPSMWEVFTDD